MTPWQWQISSTIFPRTKNILHASADRLQTIKATQNWCLCAQNPPKSGYPPHMKNKINWLDYHIRHGVID
jgi:hypothetical protein